MLGVLRLGYFWVVVFGTAAIHYFAVVGAHFFSRMRGSHNGEIEHMIAVSWSRLVIKLCPWIDLHITGQENIPPLGKAVIYVANHRSGIDILVIFQLARQFRWISKKEVFRMPVIGGAMKMVGYVSVDRGNQDSHRRAVAESARWLKRGVSMFYFPEGTRSANGEMRPFKSGAFRLAESGNAPIIPIALTGTNSILGKGAFRMGTGRVSMTVLPPINPKGFADAEAMASTARQRIAEALTDPNTSTQGG